MTGDFIEMLIQVDEISCPYCGSHDVYVGYIDEDMAEYLCGDCDEVFIDGYPKANQGEERHWLVNDAEKKPCARGIGRHKPDSRAG